MFESRIYTLAEVGTRLVQEINDLRTGPEALAKFEADLHEYNRRRHGRKEIVAKITTREPDYPLETDMGTLTMPGLTKTRKAKGFELKFPGRTEFVERPVKPHKIAWRKTSGMEGGLLAGGGRHNRPLLPARVKQYRDEMLAGRWRDCLSDPIAITDDGEVINGRHRIAAASALTITGTEEDMAKLPKFLVIFGVDPAEIALADRSKRTANDMAVITGKLAREEVK